MVNRNQKKGKTMAQIINLNQRILEKNFDRHSDPCSSCNEANKEKNCPCEEADIWWETFAKLFKKGEA
jgi:hypothetical protein